MAQKVTIELLDDLDGSVAVGTFAFTHNGMDYEIDLNETHLAEYEEMFRTLADNARRVGGKRKYTKREPGQVKGSSNTHAAREWLRNAGHEVKDRGRIPAHLMNLYAMRPQGEGIVVGQEDIQEVVESVRVEPAVQDDTEQAPEAPETVQRPKRTRKPALKAVAPATSEMAAILAFKEPEDPAKRKQTNSRTRVSKTNSQKV